MLLSEINLSIVDESFMQPAVKKPKINPKVVDRVLHTEYAINKLAREIKANMKPGSAREKTFRHLHMILTQSFSYMKDTGNTKVPKEYLKGYKSLRDVIKAFKMLHIYK